MSQNIFKVSEQLKVNISFFKKSTLPCSSALLCLSTQVLKPLSFLFGYLFSGPLSQTSWYFFTFCSCFSQTLFPVLLLLLLHWLSEHVCMYERLCVCVCFGHNVTAPCPLCTRMGPLSVHVSMCVCFLYGELDSCGYCSLLTLSSWCQAELSKPSGKLNQKKLLLHASPSKYWKKGSSTCTDLKTLQKRMALQARLQGLA